MKVSTSKPFLAALGVVFSSSSALSQTARNQGPASPGLSVSDVKYYVDPVASFIAYPIFAIVSFWNYLMSHAPAAGLLTAVIAGFIAVRSIKSNRDIARLRETFNSINSANWDADYIKARMKFSALKKQYEANPQKISRFCYPLTPKSVDGLDNDAAEQVKADFKIEETEHEDTASVLRTILNEYENQSLGIKLGILDEPFMFRYSRSSVINDWKSLNPLVNAFRARYGNNLLYIEFEGLNNAWENYRSHKTGQKMRLAKKRTSFR